MGVGREVPSSGTFRGTSKFSRGAVTLSPGKREKYRSKPPAQGQAFGTGVIYGTSTTAITVRPPRRARPAVPKASTAPTSWGSGAGPDSPRGRS